MTGMRRASGDAAATSAPSAAFLQLYDSSYSRSVRLVALTTGSNAIAEEIVQDAFVEMLGRWDAIRDPQAYLRRVLMSRSNSWLRRLRVERRHATTRGDIALWHDPDMIAFVDAVRGLAPKQRAAIVLRYDEGMSEAQIAAALGCRPGTVKSLLSRARAALREVMEGE